MECKATATRVCKLGATLIIGARFERRNKKLQRELKTKTHNPNIKQYPLDLASLESVQEFAEKVLQNHEELHILINNAGVLGPVERKTEEDLEPTFGINHLGGFHLTNLLLERLKECQGRVINITSDLYKQFKITDRELEIDLETELPRMTNPDEEQSLVADFKKYGRSKLCNIYHVQELAERHPDLIAITVNPGVVDTKINRHYRGFSSIMFDFASNFSDSPEIACETVVWACSAELASNNGASFKKCTVDPLKDHALDSKTRKAVWEASEYLITQVENIKRKKAEEARKQAEEDALFV